MNPEITITIKMVPEGLVVSNGQATMTTNDEGIPSPPQMVEEIFEGDDTIPSPPQYVTENVEEDQLISFLPPEVDG